MTIDTDAARAGLRRLRDLLEARDYYAVGGSRRYLASQRARTLSAARAGTLVVAGAALVLVVALSLLHPAHVAFIVTLNCVLGATALVGWWVLGHRMRRRPEVVVFVIGLAVLASIIAVAVGGPHLVGLAVAFLMILPTVVALVVPWRTWTEIRWLSAYAMVGTTFIVFVPSASLTMGDRGDLVMALVSTLLASFAGHVLLFREHVRMFRQREYMARLRRQENVQRQELERVHRTLEITARTDELTQVGNRMKLHEELIAVRARIERTRRSIGLLELDLDHFKGVNDKFGHLAGDAVLRTVAGAIREAVRSDESVFRYGGEEFMVILSTADDVALAAAAERVRTVVAGLELAHPGNAPFGLVTVSVGAATLGVTDLDQSANEWFARADAALYEAKAAGRNRISVATARSPRLAA